MKLTYRPEIDGLRAIAVGAVILYHAHITIFGFMPFKGGFIGVDIFFVISGYLITSIILKELITIGSFSFKYFYERRIRRILPVLLTVILISLPIAWIYLIPSIFVDFSKSILYSLGFSSNFFFNYSGQEYFAVDGMFRPFLHTWSLSVEEQYYILFPIVLLITFKYFRKYLIHTLLIGFIISLILAEWTSRNYPSTSFYFLHTRMWELLAGSMLAYFEITIGHRKKFQKLNFIMPIIGLLLIVHSIVFFNDKMLHPSFYTLSPIIGVSLIIWFSNRDDIVTKILSSKLFVGIGLISYSLYLWHYPIFSFIRINGLIMGNNIVPVIFLIMTLFVISIISYLCIELPARNKKFSFKKFFIFLCSLYLVLFISNLLIIQNNGYSERFDKLKIINQNYNPDNLYLIQSRLEDIRLREKNYNEKNLNIMIIGDSHGVDLYNALELNSELYKDTDFYYGSSFNGKLEKNFLENDKIFKNSDLLIFSYRWTDNELNKFIKILKEIESFDKNIAITSSSNEYRIKSYLFTLLDNKILFEKEKFDYFGLKKLYFDNRLVHSKSDINQKLKNLAKKEKLKYLNKEDYMCEVLKNECYYLDEDGNKLIPDYGHYSKYGARFFGRKIYEINWLKIN